MARKGFAGAAVPTTLTAAMTAVSPAVGETFSVSSTSGWSFTTVPFVVVIDRGRVTEEKVLCSDVSGLDVMVQQRGYDDTVAAIHAGPPNPATVLHVLDSGTVDESNLHANTAHNFEFIQSSPSDTWIVAHNLGYHPAVSVVDSAGSWVIGDVSHADANNLTITFTGAFAGRAYCS